MTGESAASPFSLRGGGIATTIDRRAEVGRDWAMRARQYNRFCWRRQGLWAVAALTLCSGATACTHPPSGPAAVGPFAAESAAPEGDRAGAKGATAAQGRGAAAEHHAAALPASEALPAGALPPLPGRGEVRVGDASTPLFRVELARTAEERAQGLMYRRHLAEDAGMVFDMERTGRWAFWMKNTLIPLDMVFLDRAWRVVCVIAEVPPLTLESRGCDVDSRWVLELASGVAARHQIAAGTALRWKPLPDAAPQQVTP